MLSISASGRGFPSGVRNGCRLVCTDRRNERARLSIKELDTAGGRHLGNGAVTHHVPIDRLQLARPRWRSDLGWVGKALPAGMVITVSRSTRCSPRTLSIGRKLMITPLANQISKLRANDQRQPFVDAAGGYMNAGAAQNQILIPATTLIVSGSSPANS
jgi:hypothetical protein